MNKNFTIGEKVNFLINNEVKIGIIYVVNMNGTMLSKIATCDIFCETDNMLYKYVPIINISQKP